MLQVEQMDDRVLMATNIVHAAATVSAVTIGEMANEGHTLISLYEASSAGTSAAQLAAQFPMLEIVGNTVNLHVNLSGDLTTGLSQLTSVGFKTTASSAFYGSADGFAPISALPQIAVLSQVRFVSPNLKQSPNPIPMEGLTVAVKPATVVAKPVTVAAPPKPITVTVAPAPVRFLNVTTVRRVL